jgi:hypothetical protein
MSELEKLYAFQNREVDIFLETHSEVIPTLRDVHPKIKNYFPQAELWLDHDDEAGLIIWINNKGLALTEALDKMRQFNQEWSSGIDSIQIQLRSLEA